MGGAIGVTRLRTWGVGDQPWYSELSFTKQSSQKVGEGQFESVLNVHIPSLLSLNVFLFAPLQLISQKDSSQVKKNTGGAFVPPKIGILLGLMTCMQQTRNAFRVMVANPKEQRPPVRHRHEREDHIKNRLSVRMMGGIDWVFRAEDKDKWWVVMKRI